MPSVMIPLASVTAFVVSVAGIDNTLRGIETVARSIGAL